MICRAKALRLHERDGKNSTRTTIRVDPCGGRPAMSNTNRLGVILPLFAAAIVSTVPSLAQSSQPKAIAEAGGIEALVATAKKEGRVLVYGAPSQDKFALWVKGFEDKYGIPVQHYRAPSNQVYQRFAQEQNVGRNQADAIAISELNLLRDAIKLNYLAEYFPQNASKFPKEAVIPGRAYPLYVAIQAVGWNTRVVPQDLQAKLQEQPLEALLDLRLKGKIAVVSVTAGGPQIAANGNLVYNLADQYGWRYLEKLAAQGAAVVNSTPTMLDAVIAGDYWASPDAYPSVFAPKVVEGAPLAFVPPKVASGTYFALAVANSAPRPAAARLFAEWAGSVEAQNSLAVITESDVLIEGWTDKRRIREMPWYRAPEKLWFGAPDDPRLQGENLKAFFRRWQTTYRR
jgi:ABC-type Fe3+ transport system substrate-binding protein